MDRREGSAGNTALALAVAGAGVFLLGRSLIRQRRWMDLEGKTALITGGSRGFGLLLAREFGDAGASVVICARDEAELERARRDLSSRGADVAAIPCDVTDRTQVERLIRDAE